VKVKVVVIAAGQCGIAYIDWDEVRHLMMDQETWQSSQAFQDAVTQAKEQIKAQIHKQLAELEAE
jgi:translation elongation factor P/translation initiation factor 5A